MCSLIWVGIGVGSPLLGWLSDKLESRRISLGLSACLGLLASLILLYVPNVPMFTMYGVLFILGLGAGGQTVSFAVVKDNNPQRLVGTACGFNNLSVLLGGAIFQPLVGVIIHRVSDPIIVNGVPSYPTEAYQKALAVMPSCYLMALFLILFIIKESHPASEANLLESSSTK